MSKKASKRRGSRTYGRGRGKSHNCNAGNRGGRGRAGSGKKGDAKKPSYWKTEKFGKFAFGMTEGSSAVAINVSQVSDRIESLIGSGKIKAGKEISLNLSDLGFEKLLGSGKIYFAVNITVANASKSAISKIEEAGGKVILPE